MANQHQTQPSIDNNEHREIGGVGTKAVQIYGYVPGTNTPVLISAVDNGDGTYSLKSDATFSGTVDSAPTFAQNPTDPTPTPEFGLVDADGVVQVAVVSGEAPVTNDGTFATPENQTNGDQLTQIVDSDGNAISSLEADVGQNSLLIGIGPTNYVHSDNNSSTTQLTVGQTFTGVIESIFNEPQASVLLTIDQNATLTINQYIDDMGTFLISSWAYPVVANIPFSRSFVVNGNFMNFVLKNNGAMTTTTLNLDVAYGTIPAATNLGNLPVSFNELNGVSLSSGTGTVDTGTLRVTLPSNQALNLPSGASTASGQTIGNASLSNIDSKSSNINSNTLAAATSLDIIDMWDESARAKVNIIAGQVGVDSNSGAKSDKTLRVVLATDQPQLTNALKVDASATTQPVSGTVTANLGTLNGAATSAKQDTGNASLSSMDTKLSGTLLVSDVAPSTTIAFTTTVTTAGTRVQFATNSSDAGVIQADPANADGSYVYVGDASVSSTVWGAKLAPGASTGLSITNTNKIWVDASTNGLKVGFLGS